MDTERSPGEFLFKEEMMINPTQTRAEKEEQSLPMQLQGQPSLTPEPGQCPS